jgi:hypothetical protein
MACGIVTWPFDVMRTPSLLLTSKNTLMTLGTRHRFA